MLKENRQMRHLERIRTIKQNMIDTGKPFKRPEGRPSVKKIINSFLLHYPTATKQDCVNLLHIAYSTVCKYWPEHAASKQKKILVGANAVVTAFRKNYPLADRKFCVNKTGLGYSTVCKYWHDLESEERKKPAKIVISEFRQAHPLATKQDCIKETGLGRSTVFKYW